jgi:hypothetical protein
MNTFCLTAVFSYYRQLAHDNINNRCGKIVSRRTMADGKQQNILLGLVYAMTVRIQVTDEHDRASMVSLPADRPG